MTKPTNMHILTVSNDNTNLEWVKAPLTATGFCINLINALSITEAKMLLESVKFDLVLYDVAFAGMDLSENLKSLTGVGKKIPLIALTDKIGDPLAEKAVQNGAESYMVKDRNKIATMADSFKSIFFKERFYYN